MGLRDAIPADMRFMIRKRVLGFKVPNIPSMEPEGLAMFESSLKAANRYLEYGAGGSTVMAAGMGKTTVSIEGDRYYCRAVRRKLGGWADKIDLNYVDVGPTEQWGHLRDKEQTPENVASWARYVRLPFEKLKDDFYDLVLIDGRFRVSCALHVIAEAAKRSASVRILLDDYDDPEDRRPHYRVVEDYVPLAQIAGRMAVLDVSPATLIKAPDQAALDGSVLDSR